MLLPTIRGAGALSRSAGMERRHGSLWGGDLAASRRAHPRLSSPAQRSIRPGTSSTCTLASPTCTLAYATCTLAYATCTLAYATCTRAYATCTLASSTCTLTSSTCTGASPTCTGASSTCTRASCIRERASSTCQEADGACPRSGRGSAAPCSPWQASAGTSHFSGAPGGARYVSPVARPHPGDSRAPSRRRAAPVVRRSGKEPRRGRFAVHCSQAAVPPAVRRACPGGECALVGRRELSLYIRKPARDGAYDEERGALRSLHQRFSLESCSESLSRWQFVPMRQRRPPPVAHIRHCLLR